MDSDKQSVKTDINEADIIAWLRAKAVEIGIPGLELKADSGLHNFWIARADVDDNAFGCGESVEMAVQMLRGSIKTPEQIALKKRDAAAKLLAEAEALVPSLVVQEREGAGT